MGPRGKLSRFHIVVHVTETKTSQKYSLMSEKIRLRTGHDFVHLDRGGSVAGSLTYGLSLGLRDKNGYLVKLNDLLDGSRSIEQVIEEFTRETGISSDAIRKVLVKLEKEGHLEDLSIDTSLSRDEQIRYSRSLEYFSWINKMPDMSHWRAQEELVKAKVGIIGLGGVGTAVTMHLAGVGVAKLELIDYDKVELSNLNRQYIYTTESIGRHKAEEASKYVERLNPNVEVNYEITTIESMQQLGRIFERVDLIFRCADKPDELPYWVSDAALATQTPWVECSYNGPVVNVCTFVPGITGCYRCLREQEKTG